MAKSLVISVTEAREGGTSHVFVFDRFPVVFGRDPGASLIVDRGAVSALHGVFDVDQAGVMTYSDLGSQNGTLLNGRRVRVDDPIAIREADVLTVGDLRMRILSEAPEGSTGRPARNPFAPAPARAGGGPRATEIATAGGGWHAPEKTPPEPPRSPTPLFRPANTVTAPPEENGGAAQALPRSVVAQASPGPRRFPGRGFFQPGERLANGRYEIQSFIGAGGMSAVYRANDFHLQDAVAIKMLSPELSARADAMERFEREGRSARKIRSPNVVEIYDFGNEDGTPYIVMELLPGEPLSALISRGPLSVSRALRIILDVCNGVIAAHDEGIIHRDLKPDNIFLVNKGKGDALAKVLDFGISKTADSRLTEMGMVIGTRHYQSPEQATGSAHLDARSDQFALGVILYECLTQQTPHQGANMMVVTRNLLEGRFKRPREIRADIPEELERAILRAMELNPADRFPSVRQFGNAIRLFAPPDAQALFMRLSSATHHSAETAPASPSDFAGRPGGTDLLPDDSGSGRLVQTRVLPQSSPAGPDSAGHSDSPAGPRGSRERSGPAPTRPSRRRSWIVGIATATAVTGAALAGTAVVRSRSGRAVDHVAARPTIPVTATPEPAVPPAVLPSPTPRVEASPPPVVAPPPAEAKQAEEVKAPPKRSKRRLHHPATEAAPSAPHKVGDVWVIPSQSDSP
jgi:serine/threonine protein kinase